MITDQNKIFGEKGLCSTDKEDFGVLLESELKWNRVSQELVRGVVRRWRKPTLFDSRAQRQKINKDSFILRQYLYRQQTTVIPKIKSQTQKVQPLTYPLNPGRSQASQHRTHIECQKAQNRNVKFIRNEKIYIRLFNI